MQTTSITIITIIDVLVVVVVLGVSRMISDNGQHLVKGSNEDQRDEQ
eukprot:CAMPEP_0194088866 /NCGR_PEP_ID=MMETSP0149-20130528/31423_1 /TAXON_ID=122233 /ORGANISM="Chaetoceros debilis, Strain MM31A-1" /LENGTH=46 /DNA_ID= /DNA_START= /DNA_END= /DNA_ORIENTATION=